MAPDQDPILNAAHVATLTWVNVTDCELLRRSHEALRELVRVLTNMHRQAVAAADELRMRLRDLEDDARARFDIERAELEQRVRELEGAISKLLAWSEFAFPRGEPAAIRDARAALAPRPDAPMSSRAEHRPSTP
jgi:chromosomal replication initiation ATPase DnaA